MLIDQLTASAFRGITRELTLDLTAKLTLIYAPNGTGKSSICDSVEWLLTGEVFRFRETLGKSPTEGVRNLFSDQNPAVECVLNANGETFTVRRTDVGDPNHIESRHSDRWVHESLEALLARLTPGTLPPSSHANQRLLGRKNWLRAVRFLTAPSLDLLLDCSKDADDVRSLVFSDLLGIGDLQRDQRDLEKILKDIGSKTQLNRLLREAQAAVTEVENEISVETEIASAPLFESFSAQLTSVVRRLQMVGPTVSDVHEQQLVKVQNAFEDATSRFRRKQLALAQVVEKAGRYESQTGELANHRQREAQIALARERNRTELEAAIARTSAAARERVEAERLRTGLVSLRMGKIEVDLNIALNQWGQARSQDEHAIDSVADATKLESLQSDHLRLRHRRDAVNRCLENVPVWRDALLGQRAAEQRILQIQLPSEDEKSELQSILDEAKSAYINLVAQYERLTGPLERLRSAGREFLLDASHDTNCPLCSHDYSSHQALLDAMANGLDAIPLAVSAVSDARTNQERKIAELQDRQKRWQEDLERSQNARSAAASFVPTLENARSALAELKINLASLIDDELPGALSEEIRLLNIQLEELSNAIGTQSGLFSASQELLRVADEVDAAHLKIHALLPDFSIPAHVGELAPSAWKSIVQQTDSVVATRLEQQSARVVDLAELEQRHQSTVSQLREESAALELDKQSIADQISAFEEFRRDFLTEWKILEGDTPWSVANLDTVPLKLEVQAADLAQVNEEIVSAQTTLDKAISVASREREVTSRRRQLALLRQRVKKAEAVIELRNQCDQGVSALRTSKEAFTAQQIKPLCEVITALYVRAQSNGFIDRIETNAEGGPLRWLPQIADQQLEDPVQMSQGQRQDLALAIFLARARDLGGTFFLDEPLLHLDDLNRVALLDVLRVIAVEDRPRPLRLVLTTASFALVRHCQEKLALLSQNTQGRALRVYRLHGDPRSGVTLTEDD